MNHSYCEKWAKGQNHLLAKSPRRFHNIIYWFIYFRSMKKWKVLFLLPERYTSMDLEASKFDLAKAEVS